MKRAAAVAALAAAACGNSSAPPSVGSRVGPALVAALEAADRARTPWRCAAPDGPALVEETLQIDEQSWRLAERTARLEATGTIAIGVVADAGGAEPSTLAALGRLRGKLGGADVVVALGGMGSSQAELEAALGALADRAPWPLIALPGDLEPAPAQIAAIAALRARGQNVIDGRLARRIELPGATIATIPGAGAQTRLVAGAEGCGYRPADVAAALGDLTTRRGLRIVASAEAPRISAGGEPAGELVLTPGAAQEIDVILHGPILDRPSPTRSGGRDGRAVALSPGTSDATTRLPGPRSAPSAGVLTVSGQAWKWRPITDAD